MFFLFAIFLMLKRCRFSSSRYFCSSYHFRFCINFSLLKVFISCINFWRIYASLILLLASSSSFYNLMMRALITFCWYSACFNVLRALLPPVYIGIELRPVFNFLVLIAFAWLSIVEAPVDDMYLFLLTDT